MPDVTHFAPYLDPRPARLAHRAALWRIASTRAETLSFPFNLARFGRGGEPVRNRCSLGRGRPGLVRWSITRTLGITVSARHADT
jgi:hypothetical protein